MQQNSQSGVVKCWKPDKGYGFIEPTEGGTDCFFHKSSIASRKIPVVGQRVVFAVTKDHQGRWRAESITAESESKFRGTLLRRQRGRDRQGELDRKFRFSFANFTKFYLFALPFLFATFSQAWIWLAVSAFASVIGFKAITLDKRFAQTKAWRISEKTLHLIEMFGGWPGSGLAQHISSHKTKKASYQSVFWMIAVVHVAFGVDYVFFDFVLGEFVGQAVLSGVWMFQQSLRDGRF